MASDTSAVGTDHSNAPQPVTFPEGGTVGGVRCARCGEPASRSYEGVDTLDFCERCFRDFGKWLNHDIGARGGHNDE